MNTYTREATVDYSRPLWRSVFLPNLEIGPSIVIGMHHSVCDGVGVLKILDSVMDSYSPEPS
jgi:NRPS condensation-like uncharacterized protein